MLANISEHIKSEISTRIRRTTDVIIGELLSALFSDAVAGRSPIPRRKLPSPWTVASSIMVAISLDFHVRTRGTTAASKSPLLSELLSKSSTTHGLLCNSAPPSSLSTNRDATVILLRRTVVPSAFHVSFVIGSLILFYTWSFYSRRDEISRSSMPLPTNISMSTTRPFKIRRHVSFEYPSRRHCAFPSSD